MQIEQSRTIDIIELRKKEFQEFDIVALSKKMFESINALFELLSHDAIEQQSFSYQSAQSIFDHAINVLIAEQRLASFIPQVHQRLTLLEALRNQTAILQYVQQVLAISQILDVVGKEIGIPSRLYNDAQRVIRHDVYVPKEFDASDSTGTVALFELLVQLRAISLLSVVESETSAVV